MGQQSVASKNILVVESHNDKFFIESLLAYLQRVDIEVSLPICSIDEYECLDGLSETKLVDRLVNLRIESDKRGIEKIGIMIDADAKGVARQLSLVNTALEKAKFNVQLPDTNIWVDDDSQALSISCHVLNVEGFGELETVLKLIKAGDSIFADCLDAWKSCLQSQAKTISDKDFDKFWVSIYQRFDCCDKKEKKQAQRKCSFEASMKKPIWNFEHESLAELKDYLSSFT